MHQIATDHAICSWERTVIKIATPSILILFSLVGSLLIVAVFYRNKRLRTPVHYFIMNMALSDLLIPTVYLPTLISRSYHDGRWLDDGVLGTILCKFVTIVMYVSVAVSMFSMVAIAVDRFYAIIFVMKPALFSQKTCYRLIIVTWIVSVAIHGYYFDAVKLERERTGVYCNEAFEKISFSCLFAFIALVLTVLYSIIIISLYQRKKDLHLANETLQLREKENRKVTTMLVIIVLAFYLVWVPFCVYYFQKHDVVDNCSLGWPWIAHTLPMFYTIINSLVLGIFNKTFRQGCRELLCRPRLCSNACSPLSVTPKEQNNNAENIELQELTSQRELPLRSEIQERPV